MSAHTSPTDDWSRMLDEFFRVVDEEIVVGRIRMVFWVCPDSAHRKVTWRNADGKSVPRCDECGVEGDPR